MWLFPHMTKVTCLHSHNFMKKNKNIYLILGRTGSGKTSITRQIAKELGYKILKSYTTRPRRLEELNTSEVDHEFVTDTEADELLKGDVIAYTEINNVRYFATLEQLRNSDLYVIDPNGYTMLRDRLNELEITDINLIPVYVYSYDKQRKERYMQRSDADESLFDKRNKSENAQFESFETKGYKEVYLLSNTSSFNNSIKAMREIITITS